ncbi:uncharacterized protein V6R79_005445 [Siganus canaliculatus]
MDVVLLLVAAAAGLCVVSSQGAGRQYHLIQNQVTWTEAQSYCRENYMDLVTINSMEDMEVLNNMTGSSGASRVWIGLYDDVDSWRWSLTDVTFYKPGEVDFRAWDNGQPNNSMSEEYCVTINDEGFVFVSTGMNWTEAQSYCRDHHTDLASVRNMEENNEVMNLVPAGQTAWIGLFRESWKWSDGSSLNLTNWVQGEPNNNRGFQENCVMTNFHKSGRWQDWPCDTKTVFICYSDTRTTPEPTQAHESSTPEPDPAHESSTPEPTPAHESSTPEPTPAHESTTPEPTPAPTTEEQAPRGSRKVVGVKLERSSSVDLDDPAVAQKILEQVNVSAFTLNTADSHSNVQESESLVSQLKQRLKEQGLPGDVKLSWRKKPDGKIFHQEKKETKKKKSSRRKRDEL